jgi:hypothetical protein
MKVKHENIFWPGEAGTSGRGDSKIKVKEDEYG